LVSCFKDFKTYLDAKKVFAGTSIKRNERLQWVNRIMD